MKIALHGASGRVGAAVVSLVRSQASEHQIVGAIAEPGCSAIGRDLGDVHGLAPLGVLVQGDLASALLGADVIIDFSNVKAIPTLAKTATRAGVPLVSGTTGLTAEATAALEDAAQSVAVLWASNFSIGIHVLAQAAQLVARKLGSSFDIEIVEAHHRGKADAPSGTALRLVKEVQQARGGLEPLYGRQGMRGARRSEELGVLALRGGDVVGDHSIHFLGSGERLELVHRATSRELFARGALLAAEFLKGKGKGRYSLDDVLAS